MGLTREDRINQALRDAPKNDTQIREGLAIGTLVTVNANMLALLQEENNAQALTIKSITIDRDKWKEDHDIKVEHLATKSALLTESEKEVDKLNAELSGISNKLLTAEANYQNMTARRDLLRAELIATREKLWIAREILSDCPAEYVTDRIKRALSALDATQPRVLKEN